MWWSTKPAKSADITAAELVEKVLECLARVRSLELDQERLYDKVRGVLAAISRKAKLLEESDGTPAAPAAPGTSLPGRSAATAAVAAAAAALSPATRIPRRNY